MACTIQVLELNTSKNNKNIVCVYYDPNPHPSTCLTFTVTSQCRDGMINMIVSIVVYNVFIDILSK